MVARSRRKNWRRFLAKIPTFEFICVYRNNLKNRFLAASGLPQNSHSHSGLASRQWSLAPNANSEDPPCQIPDSSSYFGIVYSAWVTSVGCFKVPVFKLKGL